MEKFFCHKKVKILVLKKEQGKNLYRYNKWETELNVCKKWPEQCSIKHVNCEATIEFLNDYGLDWHWNFQELTQTMERSSTTFEKMLVTYSSVYFF